ncbi:hypothetical protein Droror1_Dr00011998 [Drosera rotundifolia]
MIRGYLNSNSPLQSLTCYLDMLGNGISPNWFTYLPLIKSCFGIEGTVCLGDLVHAHVVVLGFERDGCIGSALVKMYAAREDMRCARKVFDKMSERDMVVGTGMVDGYGKAGEVEEAWKVFEGMRERNEVTWSVMMVSVVAACAHLGALAQGHCRFLKRFKGRILELGMLSSAIMHLRGMHLRVVLVVFGLNNKNVVACEGAGRIERLLTFPLLMGRKLIGGSTIGGIKETQEMIDFATKHGVTTDIEVIPIDYINTAMERMLKSDVRYRFVIDIGNTLKADA